MKKDFDLITKLKSFLTPIKIDYAISGGYAIDLFVGRQTRPHKDLDVAVYWEDRNRIVEYMLSMGWMVFEPVETSYLHKIKRIDDQKCIKSNIWCVMEGSTHYEFREQQDDMFEVTQDGLEQTELDYIEFLFNYRENNHFIYARNHEIRREMNKAILFRDGISYLAPEVVLLYKSTAVNNLDYQHDFDISGPMLNHESQKWLHIALKTMYPDGHEWLKKICFS